MASDKQNEILEMVRRQLRRTNPPDTKALYGRAARIDESIRELTLRQFNARYPLRVRREMARENGGQESDAAPSGLRATIRQMLFQFARDVAESEPGPELITLATETVEDYVDRIVAAG